jgi:cellulose synthase/poly-beta-1,6-N-acetylglucosamine synthase-like glycosyltransferase
MIMRSVLRALLNGYDYLVLYLGLVWLGILCLAWTPIAMIVYPLLSENRGRALGRYVIMAAFRLYLACRAVAALIWRRWMRCVMNRR